ncbi:MAG: ABC transporter ATP-binding protein [Candidatus Acetothermia bacterium]
MTEEEYLLETENLTKEFGDLIAVKDLNLSIKREEIFGFLGPNGAGKTTAIRMLVGLLEPTKGSVKFFGKEMFDSQEGLGICPQDLVIWGELTCEENLWFMGKMYDVSESILEDRVTGLLRRLNLYEKRNSLASSLSGGMKRKLNMGMGLVHDPEVVVLDEPSAGLDPQSRFSLWEYIEELRAEKGSTIILTTHLMEEADRLSDRVGIMDHGEMLVVDEPENLKRSVGEGDSISVELRDSSRNAEGLETLKGMEGTIEARQVEKKLVVRALDGVSRVPDYADNLKEEGFEISDISVRRTNTLEDVFIHLTGRELKP